MRSSCSTSCDGVGEDGKVLGGDGDDVEWAGRGTLDGRILCRKEDEIARGCRK